MMNDYFKEEIGKLAAERTLIKKMERQVEIQKSVIGWLDDAGSIIQRCQTYALEVDKGLAEGYDQIFKQLDLVHNLHENSIKDKQKSIKNHRDVISCLDSYISEMSGWED